MFAMKCYGSFIIVYYAPRGRKGTLLTSTETHNMCDSGVLKSSRVIEWENGQCF